MPAFSQRHKGYKIGVVLLVLSAVMATWGVIAPGWISEDDEGGPGTLYSDLWFVDCRDVFSGCDMAELDDADVPFQVTLGLCCLGLLLLLCSVGIVLCRNCCASVVSYSRAPEVLALLAGLVLFIGCMTYVGDNQDFVQAFPTVQYGPSFIITLTSSVLMGLAGILLSIYNKRPGTSYYSRFHPLPIPTPSSTITITSATSTTIVRPTAAQTTTTKKSVSTTRQSGYPYLLQQRQYQNGYGYYQAITTKSRGGSVVSNGSGDQYGSSHHYISFSSYHDSPVPTYR